LTADEKREGSGLNGSKYYQSTIISIIIIIIILPNRHACLSPYGDRLADRRMGIDTWVGERNFLCSTSIHTGPGVQVLTSYSMGKWDSLTGGKAKRA
jgi:hypothetical protein